MVDKNKIWLCKDDDTVITQGKMVVTDQKMYREIIRELRDIYTYVDAGRELVPGMSDNYKEYTSTGAKIYENNGHTSEYNFSYWIHEFKNPRAEVYNLIGGNLVSNMNLLDLFATLEVGDDLKKCLERFNYAKILIRQFENSSFDSMTLQQIIKQMWPNFGFYAIEALKCTDVEFGCEYNIGELNSIVASSRKSGVNVSQEISDILRNVELAKTNAKVLSLARRTHKLF